MKENSSAGRFPRRRRILSLTEKKERENKKKRLKSGVVRGWEWEGRGAEMKVTVKTERRDENYDGHAGLHI